MILLTFSPEFPSRTVKQEVRRRRGTEFFYFTIFSNLRSGCTDLVGGGHLSEEVVEPGGGFVDPSWLLALDLKEFRDYRPTCTADDDPHLCVANTNPSKC